MHGGMTMQANALTAATALFCLFFSTIPLPAQIHASPASPARSEWDKWDIALAAGYVTGSFIDASQTAFALKNGAAELNPLFGASPSRWRLFGLKAGLGTLALYIAHRLRGTERKIFLASMNVVQWGVVTWNGLQPGIGLRLKF